MNEAPCEVCNGSLHKKTEKGWEPCGCYYVSIQRRRFLAGGFPPADLQLTAAGAIEQTGYPLTGKADPAGYVRNVAKWLIRAPEGCTLVVPDRGGRDTFALGSYFALQAALAMDVTYVTAGGLIDRFFETRNLDRFFQIPFLLLSSFGGDTEHVYLPTFVERLLRERIRHQRPTVICYAANGSFGVDRLYGATVAGLVRTQAFL